MNYPATPEISPSTKALLALYAAQTDFRNVPPNDPRVDVLGQRLMASYGAIDALDGTTQEGAYARLEVALEQARTAHPAEESGIDWTGLQACLRTLMPATLREAIQGG